MWRRLRNTKHNDPTLSEAPDEVDLPIKRISASFQAREVHSPTPHLDLHIWWARSPCRLPSSNLCCPLARSCWTRCARRSFETKLQNLITDFDHAAVSNRARRELRSRDWIKWQSLTRTGDSTAEKRPHWNVLRFALLDFIADLRRTGTMPWFGVSRRPAAH